MFNTEQKIPKNFFSFIRWIFFPHKIAILFYFFFVILLSGFGTLNSYLLKKIVDALGNPGFTIESVILPSVLFLVNQGIYHAGWEGPEYINIKITPLVKNKIINSMFDYVHKHSHTFFQNNMAGSISNKIYTLAENVTHLSYFPLLFLLRGLSEFLIGIVSMSFVSPFFSIALLVWGIIFTYISLFFSLNIKNLSDDYAKSDADLSGKIVDSITNANNVRIFSRRNYELKYLYKYLNTVQFKFRKKQFFIFKLSLVQSFTVFLLIATIFSYLIKLKIDNQISVGEFIFISTLTFSILETVWVAVSQFDVINDYIGKSQQSLNTILTPIEVEDISNAKPIKVTKGEIIFDNVVFKYAEDERPFKYDCKIKAGQKVGLVGYSGSGKSTFINLILRLYNLEKGKILIDGQDIKLIQKESLRENLGMIPQDATLFNRTLLENLKYGKLDASYKEVIDAAKKAHVDDFAQKLSKKYNSVIGERGTKLSGGQKQRISIARAILKNARILILDEATSALDSVTEGKIQSSLDQLMKNKTTIVIAHRLSTLLNMDRILVFHNRTIVEDGTHQELLEKGGLYKELWNEQIGGFLPDEQSV